ncbi:MAG: SDR family NAD(P)-dependent oxidoreductase [Deltaproteobacteria bacterium]|nr:SDR family NAD(P)-dependent oxidoreductase [Deltaproteobacteria bacterium]
MSKELRFDEKVAIVTGAGGGLGRSHALLLAARGAKVVVNDLGGSFTGDGKSSSAADKVVAEIKEAGGQAVANYDSVEDGDKIVKTAIDAFGRIDIVINNAGILRDVSFKKMTQADWDLVYKVHVLGAFRVTHAAWPYMNDAGYGRIVNTASAAGIYGNFGQANYAMAKLGIHGFTQTLAAEGRKRNVIVNTIAPIAGSRMTETVLPKELLDALKPEYVSALVARLAHESNSDTGGLYEVGGGFFAKLRWERSEGKTFRLGRSITPEDVDASWKDITQFDKTTHPGSVAESMQPIMGNVEAGPSKGGNALIDVDAALGYKYPEFTSSYDERDVSLYALGVGAAKDPTDERDLQLVYELSGKGMKVLPSFGVVPAISMVFTQGKNGIQAPGLNFGLDRVLHGEQYTEVKRPLPRAGKLTTKATVKNIYDKGKNALVVTEFITYDEHGDELVKNELTTFVRGGGGWGGERGPSADVNVPPDRAPDKVIEDKTSENQALLYRLSGDWNPLHADPSFAKAFGFQKPILHGLCSFGYATRHVAQAFAPDGNPDYVKSIKARFASTVLPGETLVTEMWKDGEHRVVFRTKVKERGEVVISNAAVELHKELPKAKDRSAKAAASSGGATAAVPNSADIFRAIGAFVGGNPATAEKVKTNFLFKLSAPESAWTIDLTTPPGTVTEGVAGKAVCTLEMSDADFMAMATGQADAMKLFSTGKLKISGDVMASQKLGFLKKLTPEMVLAETKKRTGGAGAGVPPTAAAGVPADYVPTTDDVFAVIEEYLKQNPDLAAKVNTTYLWKIGSKTWTLDLKGAGSVKAGGDAGECTLELTEDDFLALTQGKADAMKLFTTGKLKISGNVMASQKLQFLSKLDPTKAVEVIAKRRGAAAPAGATAPAAASAPKSSAEAQAPKIFAALTKRLADNPGLQNDVRATLKFVVDGNEQTFAMGGNDPKKVDATLTINDADLVALVTGKATAKNLFQHGQLKVEGDVTVAHRLGFLNKLV